VVVKILLLNGPNLDRLGTRQPEIYGAKTLGEIVWELERIADDAGGELIALQSADPEVLVHAITETDADGIIINPASLTHHSGSLRDALAGFEGPIIEVHISNIARREPYRRHSMIAGVATGSIVGLGVVGYRLALEALLGSR
jgi:3-dehydroquinate dehydratase II